MEQDGVARLMVSRYLLILLGYYLASLLSTDSHLHEGPVDIALLDAANTSKSDLLDRQRVAMEKMQTDFQKVVNENKDLRRSAKKKKFWGSIWNGFKVGGAAAGGFILGRAIK